MTNVYVYVVDRDFGFAPNPFYGVLTLATCKPRIRSVASIGDWVIGVGGARLRMRGRCIFGMRVTSYLTFDEYWVSTDFREKKPTRNGSLVRLVGDNIYHRSGGKWIQVDSHHSNADGTPNQDNVKSDTAINRVLISEDFRYLGSAAEVIPADIIAHLQYENRRNHRTFDMARASPLVEWVQAFPKNRVLADPVEFSNAAARYERGKNRVIR